MRKFFAAGTWAFCLLGAAALVLGGHGEIYAQQGVFPRVTSYEIFERFVTSDFRISNDAAYMFEPWLSGELFIRSPESSTDILYHGSGYFMAAGWSADNTHVAVGTINYEKCPFAAAQTYVTVIDMETKETTSMCIPFRKRGLSLAWSPFNDRVLFANETWVIDLERQTAIPDSSEVNGAFSDFQATPSVGYDRYLWDLDRHTPLAVIDLGTTVHRPVSTEPFVSPGPPTIESAWFDYCLLGDGYRTVCKPIIDITTGYPGAFVYDWQVNADNLLAWLAAESDLTGPLDVQGIRGEHYLDTVLYMTDLSTLETREIFRLSELDMEGVYSNALDWSPDGKTIGLSVGPIASGPTSYGDCLLVLHLD
jgi:hypothetical protein